MSGKQAKRLRKTLAELDRGEFYLEIAKRNLRRRGELRPMIFIDGPEETVVVDVGALWTTREGKRDSIPRLGGTLGFGLAAESIWVVADSWVRTPRPGEDPDELVRQVSERGLEGDPLAVDCIVILRLDAGGSFEGWRAEYRKAASGLRFSPKVHVSGEEGASFETQFSRFFDAQRATEAKARELASLADVLDGTNERGETWLEVARRTARTVALRGFGAEVFSAEDLAKAAKAAKRGRKK